MAALRGLWPLLSEPVERQLLQTLSYGLIGVGGVCSLALCFVPTPYGRYSSRRFGCPLPVRLAWMLQELPSLLVPLGLSLFSGAARVSEWPNRLLLALFIGHYAHRALIFPFLIRGGKPTPFIPFALALIFCICNGYLQGRSLSNYAEYPSGWLTSPCFIVGFAGWLGGMAINISSDHILRNLREPGETGYKIPRGQSSDGPQHCPSLVGLMDSSGGCLRRGPLLQTGTNHPTHHGCIGAHLRDMQVQVARRWEMEKRRWQVNQPPAPLLSVFLNLFPEALYSSLYQDSTPAIQWPNWMAELTSSLLTLSLPLEVCMLSQMLITHLNSDNNSNSVAFI